MEDKCSCGKLLLDHTWSELYGCGVVTPQPVLSDLVCAKCQKAMSEHTRRELSNREDHHPWIEKP